MKTLIRGIDFGPVVGASGVQGFFGEGYPHHHKLPFSIMPGFSFDGMGFVAKTVTLNPRPGNMPLEEDGLTPKEKRPDCIRWNFFAGAVLNAVGLSNNGAEFYLNKGQWQLRTDPFKLSFMSVGADFATKRAEFLEFKKLLKSHLPKFRTQIGLEANYTCPNTGHGNASTEELVESVISDMEVAHDLNVAFIPKFNVLLPIEVASKIANHPRCDAICISNTIPWGELPSQIHWDFIFHSWTNPLAKYKGGGLSGTPITRIVESWVNSFCRSNPPKPLCAGGGVMDAAGARRLLRHRTVSSVFIGTAAILRPWRVQSIIKAAHAARR